MPRTGSLPYVFLTSVIAFALAGMLWGIFDSGMIQPILDRPTWMSGSETAMVSRQYVATSWQWLPAIILFGLGLTNVIAARTVTSSTSVILRTVTVFVVHFLLVLWAFVFPEMIDELYIIFLNSPEMAEAGYETAGSYVVELGMGYGPALFAIGIDLWYLAAPIKNDYYGGIR